MPKQPIQLSLNTAEARVLEAALTFAGSVGRITSGSKFGKAADVVALDNLSAKLRSAVTAGPVATPRAARNPEGTHETRGVKGDITGQDKPAKASRINGAAKAKRAKVAERARKTGTVRRPAPPIGTNVTVPVRMPKANARPGSRMVTPIPKQAKRPASEGGRD